MKINWASYANELEKIGARAGLKMIGKLVGSGTPEALQHAGRLATTPGVLKPSMAGSQIRHLGKGGEGLATLVADPQYGVAVRKLYDPTSTTPRMIGRKVQAGKTLVSSDIAQTYGFRRTPQGGRMTFHEYVPGGPATEMQSRAIRQRVQDLGAKQNLIIQDVRSPNIVGGKIIDYLPFRPGESFRTPTEFAQWMGKRRGLNPESIQEYAEMFERNQGFIPTTPRGARLFRGGSGVSQPGMYRLMGGSPTRTPASVKNAFQPTFGDRGQTSIVAPPAR